MTLLDLFRQFSLLVTLPAVLLAAAGMVLIVVRATGAWCW